MKALPIGWFIVAGLTLVAAMLRMAGAPEELRVVVASETVLMTLSTALFTVAVGLGYWAVLKAGAGAAVAVLGWIHLVLVVLTQAVALAGGMVRDAVMAGDTDVGVQQIGLYYGISSGLGILAAIMFLAAMAVALGTVRAAVSDDAFA